MTEPESSSGPDATNAPAMSLGARMANVFVSPAEVFDDVKASPPEVVNWLVPLVATIIVGIIYSFVVFSQPAVLQQMKDPGEKKIQEQVDSGKMPRSAADQADAVLDKIFSPSVFIMIGIGAAVVMNPALLFLTALIVWLIGTRAFDAPFEYMKAVEVVALSGLVLILDAIFMMLLGVIYGSIYMNPGPVLFVSHFDAANHVHLALSGLDVFWIWYATVLSIGLSRLSGVSFWKSAAWGYAFWAMFKLGPVLVGVLFSHGGK